MFRPGQRVRWASGSRGLVTAKQGKVVARLDPEQDVVEYLRALKMDMSYRLDQISEWRNRDRDVRRKSFSGPRYLVAVQVASRKDSKPMLYLPRTESLKSDER